VADSGGQVGIPKLIHVEYPNEILFYRAPEQPIDWQLPQTDYYTAAPVVSTPSESEPPAKRFKEKTIGGLDAETAASAPATFKRKFIKKGNSRQRVDD